MSILEEHYTQVIKLMTYDEGFILHPEEAKKRIEDKGFIVVMIKNDNNKFIVLARPEDISEIQKAIHSRYYLLNQHNAEY